MITFIIALALLIGGYMIYGRFVNNVFGPDNRETPAVTNEDGVDYIVMPSWKIFMIQAVRKTAARTHLPGYQLS